MTRRTFLLSAAASAALLLGGCKGNDPAPAQGGGDAAPAAAHQCACPPGECACAECKDGHAEPCACAAPKADAGGQ